MADYDGIKPFSHVSETCALSIGTWAIKSGTGRENRTLGARLADSCVTITPYRVNKIGGDGGS